MAFSERSSHGFAAIQAAEHGGHPKDAPVATVPTSGCIIFAGVAWARTEPCGGFRSARVWC